MSLRITQDTLTPDLRRRAKAVSDPTPILRVMGATLVSYTVQTFSELVPRARPWRAKKDGTPSNLQRTTALRQSIRIVSVDRKRHRWQRSPLRRRPPARQQRRRRDPGPAVLSVPWQADDSRGPAPR